MVRKLYILKKTLKHAKSIYNRYFKKIDKNLYNYNEYEDSLKSFFKKSNLLKNNTISNIHDPMDKELFLKRI